MAGERFHLASSPRQQDLSSVDAVELERRKQALIGRIGEWRFHNMHLRDGVFTIGPDARAQERRLPPVMELVHDVLGGVAGRRALDLGCMEGIFSIELGRHGANVLGVEGREAHVARAEFARQAIGLENVEFRHEDVRRLTHEREGEFDLVLALGILYHLDAPDIFRFAREMAAMCAGVAIIDTHYSLRAGASWDHEGAHYAGLTIREHDPADTAADRQRSFASSIGNLESVWLTRPSLFNLLQRVGFRSLLEVQLPRIYPRQDRVLLVAFKGRAGSEVASAPHLGPWASPGWLEGEHVRPSPRQTRRGRLLVRLAPLVPAALRRALIKRRRSARGKAELHR